MSDTPLFDRPADRVVDALSPRIAEAFAVVARREDVGADLAGAVLIGLRYTDLGLEPRMERVYPTPWTRCDREADYRQAWAEFERRLGKKMPEGTPL